MSTPSVTFTCATMTTGCWTGPHPATRRSSSLPSRDSGSPKIGPVTFQRARSEEHREVRRRSILDTATAMLQDMPVSDITLNELSRRVGLAKSAMLRYFESREAVLLDLLDDAL